MEVKKGSANMKMHKYPGRITKSEARKRWNCGKPFIIVPCKCHAYRNTHTLRETAYGLGEMATMVDPCLATSFYVDFDSFVVNFEYYNCNPESGRYSAFYVPQEEIK